MIKILTFIFKKPSVKKGNKLCYYDKTCIDVFFCWKYGIWFIKIDNDTAISYELELFYLNEKQNKI